MKLIIAGGRDLTVTPGFLLETILHFSLFPTEIVSGGAQGIDACGEVYADKYKIPLKVFMADWDAHGKAAGPMRNRLMAEYGDMLLLIWDGESRGSLNMKTQAFVKQMPVFELILKKRFKT